MKTILLFISTAFSAISFAQTKVNYNVFYSSNIENEGLKVELKYKTKKAQDSIYFHYTNSGWGEENLFNCLQILENENPSLSFNFIPDSNRIVVHYPKSKKVTLNYRIHQDYPGDSLNIVDRPRMSNDYFHIHGRELFVVPEEMTDTEDRIIEATINWVDFPTNYVIHNTFASNVRSQVIKGEIHTGLYHSLFVGGDYRLYQFDYQSKSIVFAIRGNWFSEYNDDQKMLSALKKTIVTQRDFWNDHTQKYYTVIMTPTVSQNDSLYLGQSANGSAIRNGFMIQSSNNPFNQFSILSYMFNHEMMHQWIGLSIRNAHEELNYWFSEGFTEYYTFKNRVRSNDTSMEEWCTFFNEEIFSQHYKNPKRNEPNYVILDGFWTNRDVEKIPYRRGAIFAFWLDNKIMKASNYSKSLDDLMRAILGKCQSENLLLSDELFLEEAMKFTNNEDISYEFQKYILNGEDITFTPQDLIDCFTIELKENIPQIVLKDSERPYILME